jgi:hypothetical protein
MIDQPIALDNIDIYKIKIVPSSGGGTTEVSIFKRTTGLLGDLVYGTTAFDGTIVDPADNDNSGVYLERGEGYVCAYEDLDTNHMLHIKITNNAGSGRTYNITIVYEASVNQFTYVKTFTDFTDPLDWTPVYPQSGYAHVSFPGLGTLRIAQGAHAPNVGGIAGVISNFKVYPDLVSHSIDMHLLSGFCTWSNPTAWNLDSYSGMYLISRGNIISGCGLATGLILLPAPSISVCGCIVTNIDSYAAAVASAWGIPADPQQTLEMWGRWQGAYPSGTHFASLKSFSFIYTDSLMPIPRYISASAVNTGHDFHDGYYAGFRVFIGMFGRGADSNIMAVLEFDISKGILVYKPWK